MGGCCQPPPPPELLTSVAAAFFVRELRAGGGSFQPGLQGCTEKVVNKWRVSRGAGNIKYFILLKNSNGGRRTINPPPHLPLYAYAGLDK